MNPIYFLGWILFRTYFLLYHRIHIYNPERVPNHGPVIVAANHSSYLDPPAVGSSSRRMLGYLARGTLFKFPPFRAILRACQAVPVDRDRGGPGGLKTILERLSQGAAIVLFPEGTRSPDGRFSPARPGLGLAVIKSAAPVVPVRIFNLHKAFGRHHAFPRPFRVAIKFGQPMHFETLRAEAVHCSKDRLKQIYQEISENVMAAIGNLEPVHEQDQFPVAAHPQSRKPQPENQSSPTN